MSDPLLYAAVAAAGGIGALARLHIILWIGRLVGVRLPWGTLVVNAAAAAAAGAVLAAEPGRAAHALLAVGVLGSLSTFSTWMLDSRRLFERGRTAAAVANLVVTLAVGGAAAAAGFAAACSLG